MNERKELYGKLSRLPDAAITTLLQLVAKMYGPNEVETVPACPYCEAVSVIRYGHKHGKQRFCCKGCGRTFVTTTHTVMSHSHFGIETWREGISDTFQGKSLDHTGKRLKISHQAAFDMRHKILLALQELPEVQNVQLTSVAELDETFVLDCYKGKRLDDNIGRKPRKHGAIAQKCGLSDEYICVCAGVERNGPAYAAAVNRAKPDLQEIQTIFDGHISDGTLVLCDGARSYNAVRDLANCTLFNCNHVTQEEKAFFHLNTVNSFHSFFKRRYKDYRGVATKYLNRYNTLLASAFRNLDTLISQVTTCLLSISRVNRCHTIRDVKRLGILTI